MTQTSGCDRFMPRPDRSGFTPCDKNPTAKYILERTVVAPRVVKLCKECANHFIVTSGVTGSHVLRDEGGNILKAEIR